MRRVEFLIETVPQRTDNERWSDTEGITDDELLGYLNDAQDILQEQISARGFNIFDESTVMPIIGGQEFYDLSAQTFTGGRIKSVEESPSTTNNMWTFLPRLILRNRDSSPAEAPTGYIPFQHGFYLVGVPQTSNGFLRVVSQRELYDLDKRRGEVALSSIISGELQSVTILDNDNLDEDCLEKDDYFCICDKDGDVKVDACPVISYDGPTLTITTSRLTDAVINAGDFVTCGKYTSTHSTLPRVCERFLIAYAQVSMQDRDAMQVPTSQNQRLAEIMQSIIDTFADRDQDIRYFPQSDDYWFR